MTTPYHLQIDLQTASDRADLPDATAIQRWVEAALWAGGHEPEHPPGR